MSKGKKQKSKPAGVRRDAQGRAHLVIQRDEYGTPVGLALDRPLFNDRLAERGRARDRQHGARDAR